MFAPCVWSDFTRAHQTMVPTFKFKVVIYFLIRWYTTATACSPDFGLITTNALLLMFTTFRLRSTAPATPTPSNHSTPSILQSISETPSTPCNSRHCATKKRSREDQDKNLPFASSAPPKASTYSFAGHSKSWSTNNTMAIHSLPNETWETKQSVRRIGCCALDSRRVPLLHISHKRWTQSQHTLHGPLHSKYSQHFLQGTSKLTILDAWFQSPDGRISEGSPDPTY